jgi:UDP-N-acetylglucosamine diphosphorylase / glucose-1-phosphate thymidylyltransferase / UDP-N-acetylgalactosamine diphosphorylase / glucosamine-1-phosphate N-acetyltransferase / galactosamine-1-phosphate N-acetyltransferase
MVSLKEYIKGFEHYLTGILQQSPWELTGNAQNIVRDMMSRVGAAYRIDGNVAIHKEAKIEEHAVIKGPAIISEQCFIAAHAYLRGGVFLGPGVVVGPGTEIKSSFIMNNTAMAHFNFVGDSLIGSFVNMEAGSVIANHYNERSDKTIHILLDGKQRVITSEKFGALVGDGCRIGANAVLSPGTILKPGSIVKRLELVKQCD